MADRVFVPPIEWTNETPVIRPRGVVDATSYLTVRHAIVKVGTESPPAVIVVLDELTSPTGSAWSVLTSASWLLRQWPGIRLLAVSGSNHQREELVRNGIARYVPIHTSVSDAVEAVQGDCETTSLRVRARHSIPRTDTAVAQSRARVAETLDQWGRPECVPAARCVTTLLVENVMKHTQSGIDLRIEARGDLITIALQDDNPMPASLSETSQPAALVVSGLSILSALVRAWGNSPGGDGKTVWAVLGPENFYTFSS